MRIVLNQWKAEVARARDPFHVYRAVTSKVHCCNLDILVKAFICIDAVSINDRLLTPDKAWLYWCHKSVVDLYMIPLYI